MTFSDVLRQIENGSRWRYVAKKKTGEMWVIDGNETGSIRSYLYRLPVDVIRRYLLADWQSDQPEELCGVCDEDGYVGIRFSYGGFSQSARIHVKYCPNCGRRLGE